MNLHVDLYFCLLIFIIYMSKIYINLISLFMYSYFRNDLPEYFQNYFTLNKNKYSYNSRSASNIFID